MSEFEKFARKMLGIPEGMYGVVVPDEPYSVQPMTDDPPVKNMETVMLLVPEKQGWCDECFDVHRHYCPEDVLEAQFRHLKEGEDG